MCTEGEHWAKIMYGATSEPHPYRHIHTPAGYREPIQNNVNGMRKLGTAWMQNELLGLVSGELRQEGGQMALIEGTNTSLFIKMEHRVCSG